MLEDKTHDLIASSMTGLLPLIVNNALTSSARSSFC